MSVLGASTPCIPGRVPPAAWCMTQAWLRVLTAGGEPRRAQAELGLCWGPGGEEGAREGPGWEGRR